MVKRANISEIKNLIVERLKPFNPEKLFFSEVMPMAIPLRILIWIFVWWKLITHRNMQKHYNLELY